MYYMTYKRAFKHTRTSYVLGIRTTYVQISCTHTVVQLYTVTILPSYHLTVLFFQQTQIVELQQQLHDLRALYQCTVNENDKFKDKLRELRSRFDGAFAQPTIIKLLLDRITHK